MALFSIDTNSLPELNIGQIKHHLQHVSPAIPNFDEIKLLGGVVHDFAALRYLGSDFVKQIIKDYQKLGGDLEREFPQRLERALIRREIAGLYYAMKHPESGELRDSLLKVSQVLQKST